MVLVLILAKVAVNLRAMCPSVLSLTSNQKLKRYDWLWDLNPIHMTSVCSD